jgi:Fe-S-cluster containining protein
MKVECRCAQCRAACNHAPGWMTMEEAEAAIKAGLAKKLMVDWWETHPEHIMLLCPAAVGREGKRACTLDELGGAVEVVFGGKGKGRCTFFKDNKCELHTSGFKPEECRLTFACAPDRYGYDERKKLAMSWDSARGKAVVKRWAKEVKFDMPNFRETVG